MPPEENAFWLFYLHTTILCRFVGEKGKANTHKYVFLNLQLLVSLEFLVAEIPQTGYESFFCVGSSQLTSLSLLAQTCG